MKESKSVLFMVTEFSLIILIAVENVSTLDTKSGFFRQIKNKFIENCFPIFVLIN